MARGAQRLQPFRRPGPLPALPGGGGGLPLGQALLWAALGGLILNLMPCVFPILAMKALGIARLSGAARATVRAHGASYTAGVVLSFLLLGGLLLGLRLAGQTAGWGFQFTSPVFVALTGWLMLAVGLNLSGVFNVGGPVGAGGALAARGGHGGSFATGALAVLVATPAPRPLWPPPSAPPWRCRRPARWRSSAPWASAWPRPMRCWPWRRVWRGSCPGPVPGWTG
ncbi:hypothetical protein ACFQU7_17070 [Pseudoroseomonas wenyumeiae]